jgi:signal transduction histidine kinase/CheY-like chemotaxis protein/HPt (histidine-containing phosphotransfer) domain-containing protein
LKRLSQISVSVFGQVLLLVATLGLIWGSIGLHSRQEYQRARHDAENRTSNLARAFEETVSRSIAVLDQALEHVRDLYIRDPERFTLENWLRGKTVLRDISVQVSVANASGLVLTTTTVNPPANVNIFDREHFQVHVAATEDRLFISKPVIGRSSGRLSVQLSRRMTAPDGRFAGVVVASLDPHVLGVFRESSRVGEGFAKLIGRDGVIRSAQPNESTIGASMLAAADPDMARMFQDGTRADEIETTDTQDSIVSYRSVTGYPLFVAVGISRRAAFASFEHALRDTILGGAFLSLIVTIVGVVTIRQQYRLTRFHHALNLTLENISQGVLMIDTRRRMPVVNGRVAELLGLPLELASPGADFDALVRWQETRGEVLTEPPGDRRTASMVNAGDVDRDMPFYERTGSDGTVLEVRTSVLADGSAVRTFTDVTERKRIEHEMADARDAAQAGVRARSSFLAVMSHEIRTPMNGIIGASGLLRDMTLDAEQREYVRIIRESSEHLSSLIQNILDFSRLDAGGWELEQIPFDPHALVASTIAMLKGEAQARHLTMGSVTGSDVPTMVTGDPSRLRQILVNLIGNAIKFTDSGGVNVELRLDAEDERTVTLGITVADTGIGIDPASISRLFSAFTQVDSSISRRFGGTGLGLAICKHLATLMGGTIGVASAPGQGSTFAFNVRLLRAPTEQAAARATAPPGRHLKVLLAEDDATNRHVATRMLTRMGHAVDAVEDGAHAVSAAASADYDVILMDMMMPEVDGLAATRMIRAGTSPRCHTVIIGLTANTLPADRAACAAAGMNDYVTKPVTLDRLRVALEQAAASISPPPDQKEAQDSSTLDRAFLRRLAGEIGTDGAAELIGVFREDAPARMVAIRAAMAHGAIQTVRLEAHALAGAARNVGLVRLGDAADALRRASEQAGPSQAAVELVAAALDDSLPLAAAWADAHQLTTSGT